MLFIHDTEVALQGMAALVNTRTGAGEGRDHLSAHAAAQWKEDDDTLRSEAELDAFATRWRWSGRRERTAVELEQVRALRPRLAELWGQDVPATAALVNTLLAQAQAVPQLVTHDEWGWHLHATPADAPFATRMAVEGAMAMVDVVRAGETSRLRRCAVPDCQGLFVDLSRNRSKRFCSTTCGNRVAAAAYRERRADGRGAASGS